MSLILQNRRFFFFKTFSSWAQEAENPRDLSVLKAGGPTIMGHGGSGLDDELPPGLQVKLQVSRLLPQYVHVVLDADL